jgi:hypothetical protein
MYKYILGQWTMGKVTAGWVMSTVPKFITEAQCAVILATPQTTGTLSMEV